MPDTPSASPPDICATRITLSGKVQGVGFRPFIFRLAHQYGISGWVRNCVGQVEIHAQGSHNSLQAFTASIFTDHPPVAQPRLEASLDVITQESLATFRILESRSDGEANISVPTDLDLCPACLQEMQTPSNRRYRYPFINCTECGPRYTLIESLPYDRPNTTMKAFPMCPACQREYEDPLSRRFHAEPIACPACGPELVFHAPGEIITGNDAAMAATVAALRNGEIVAIKGVGGYHLMCDAQSDTAIKRLRECKQRPDKPLAVMIPADASELCLTPSETDFLTRPERPILTVNRHALDGLSTHIAPGLDEVGIMLPYTPQHHLLLDAFGAPVVATSANISGEPVLTDNLDAEQRLIAITRRFLHHNRPIVRPADDPLFRTIAGQPRPIRLGRGNAPFEVNLPFTLDQPVLAVGTQMKNTVTLAWGQRAVISPHIGEMHTARALQVFENTIADLQKLYQTEAQLLICDAHPGYTASRWAAQQGLALHKVFHHHAHASAASYEFDCTQRVIAFTWDGIGMGADSTLWGGETFIGTPGAWQRVASFRTFRLPGGDKAGRDPWRSAAALCWESGHPYAHIPQSDPLLKAAWERGLNAPLTSSVGRLFDAAAALTRICPLASYEGQGAMQLEACANSKAGEVISLPLREQQNMLIADWQPLVAPLSDETVPLAERAAMFHSSMAHTILNKAQQLRQRHDIDHVTLSGGVFQNRLLTEQAISLLEKSGFTTHLSGKIPVNDAGISLGQVIDYHFASRS